MTEKETLYLLGAGFNRCIEDIDGIKPPLATNFFQTLFRKKHYQKEGNLELFNPLFEYIEKYWKKSKNDLKKQPFDLEECFTLSQLHWIEAARDKNQDKYDEATKAFSLLTGLLSEVLAEFNDVSFFRGNDFLTPFGKKVYEERPNIITFNYDTFLEKAIGRASGVRVPATIHSLEVSDEKKEISDEELAYCSSNWNCALGYGFQFDEVQLQRPGIGTPVDGERILWSSGE